MAEAGQFRGIGVTVVFMISKDIAVVAAVAVSGTVVINTSNQCEVALAVSKN